MQEAVKPQVRYRINVSRSVKNVYTYDCTVELVDEFPRENSEWDWVRGLILSESEKLVTELDAKYPAGNGG